MLLFYSDAKLAVLYDVLESLKRKFTLGAYTSILQLAIEDTDGQFVIRRGVFSTLFVSFCRRIRRDALDQVCPRSLAAASTGVTTMGSPATSEPSPSAAGDDVVLPAAASTSRAGTAAPVSPVGKTTAPTARENRSARGCSSIPACCNTVSLDGVRFAPRRDCGTAVDVRETLRVPPQLDPKRYYLITDSMCRQLLLRWAGLPVKGPLLLARAAESGAFTAADRDRLARAVTSYAPFVRPLLYFRDWTSVPKEDAAASSFFSLYIRCVAAAHVAYPIISGFQEGKFEALRGISSAFESVNDFGGFADHVAALARFGVPAFGDLVTHDFLHLSCTVEEKRDIVRVLGVTLREMVRIAESYHAAVAGRGPLPLERERISFDDDITRGACFPPDQRYRLLKKLELPSESSHVRAPSQHPSCEYYYKSDPSSFFLPCIVFLWCMCGINIGFQVLQRPESVSSIIALLLERFPMLPLSLFYDFSCGLMRSAIRSAPSHFEGSALVHDPVHGKGHCSSCSPAYDVKYAIDASMRSKNSVVAEQRNSRIRAWARTIEFMSLINATVVMSVLMASMNADLKRKMVPAPPPARRRRASAPPVSPPPFRIGASPRAATSSPDRAPMSPGILTSSLHSDDVDDSRGLAPGDPSSPVESCGAGRPAGPTVQFSLLSKTRDEAPASALHVASSGFGVGGPIDMQPEEDDNEEDDEEDDGVAADGDDVELPVGAACDTYYDSDEPDEFADAPALVAQGDDAGAASGAASGQKRRVTDPSRRSSF